jgi:hypothetical protein
VNPISTVDVIGRQALPREERRTQIVDATAADKVGWIRLRVHIMTNLMTSDIALSGAGTGPLARVTMNEAALHAHTPVRPRPLYPLLSKTTPPN